MLTFEFVACHDLERAVGLHDLNADAREAELEATDDVSERIDDVVWLGGDELRATRGATRMVDVRGGTVHACLHT